VRLSAKNKRGVFEMLVLSDCPYCKYWIATPERDAHGFYHCRHCDRIFPDDSNPEPLKNKLIESIEALIEPARKNNQETTLRFRNRSNYSDDNDGLP
jgi:ribosomal protein L37AE/L43A